ncbi:MAG: hypothetical protein NC355_07340 [Blautia sp.]|nr:hypothetical protein [Blautia sp.]
MGEASGRETAFCCERSWREADGASGKETAFCCEKSWKEADAVSGESV